MNEWNDKGRNSKISIQSFKSRNSGSMSLGRPSFEQRNHSLSKKPSLIYVMSIESSRKSNSIDNMFDQSSYSHAHNLIWNRNSLQNNVKIQQSYDRRPSNQGRTLGHSCDCYPSCKGTECPCFSARSQICLKQSCCQTCIQMKNALLMADRGESCNCKNNQCLKLYCKCFNNNGVCTSLCKCQDCHNKIDSKQRAQAIQNMKNSNHQEQQNMDRKFCTCKKTKCNKKYCSCFANGIKCSKNCQCQNCINCDMIMPQQEDLRPPSFYKQEQLAELEMPQRMSFQKVDFSHSHN